MALDESSSTDEALALFNKICDSTSMQEIQQLFKSLSREVGVDFDRHGMFYPALKAKLSSSWKFTELSALYDKRVAANEYAQQKACEGMRCIVIGAGPVGLRTAIEAALLGAKVDVVEKREGYSRNNVLHLWPFLITDLRNIGAKRFYGKFCSGDLDHISIRMLELVLLKAALFLGVKFHSGVEFKSVREPTGEKGWRAEVTPSTCPVSSYSYDIMVGADGKKYVLPGFRTKEFRPKLAIAITANFVNHYTQEEARVPEISGIAYIYHQEFFNNLRDRLGIELENLVYYKDETHYFVMTTKKQSLLARKVLKQDFDDAAALLNSSNISQKCLQDYAREVAVYATKGGLARDTLEFKLDARDREDVALFDFTSLFAAENAARIVERRGKRVLMCIVGDSLIEPFWPTGSGLGRGFLGALDAAWMMKGFGEGKPAMDLIEEREATLQLLSQTKPERLSKNFQGYTINPTTRYMDIRGVVPLGDLSHLHDTGQGPQQPTEIIRSGLASKKGTETEKGLSRNRRRYKTISGTRSIRAQAGDNKEKIDLDFLKNWGKSGNDSLSDKAITYPAVGGHGESKMKKTDAKQPGQSDSVTGTKPEPVKAQRQPGDAKAAPLSSSTAKGLTQVPAKKTLTSEKSTKPTKLPKPSKLPRPVEDVAQTSQSGAAHTGGPEATTATSGTETEEASSQPQGVKKRLSLFTSLLRPASPKKREKASGPSKAKRPSSAKEKHSGTASPQKKASDSPVSRQGKGSPRSAKPEPGVQKAGEGNRNLRPSSAKEKHSGSASPQKKASDSPVSRQGKGSPRSAKPEPGVQKAGEGNQKAPTSNSEAKVQPRQHEHSSPSERVTRSQSMVNVSINNVVSFYEQRISQLQPSAGASMPATKTPSSNLRQSHAARRHGRRGREEVDSALYSRAYHSMMDLSVAAGPPPQPAAKPAETPPSAPATPPVALPPGEGRPPPTEVQSRPGVEQRRKHLGRRPVTWVLDNVAESKGEVDLPPMTQEGGDSCAGGSGRWRTGASAEGAPPPSEPLWLVRYIASLNQSMEGLRKGCDIIEAKTALEILHTIICNVELHPDEDRYRRVRVSSLKFNEQVWKRESCRSFLLKSGWSEIDDFIVAPIGKSLAVPLRVVSKHLSIVNNMIWSMQVEIPNTQRGHHLSRTHHGSLRHKEDYATMVVNDAMDKVAEAAQKLRRTPSPKPILEEEDDECCDSHHLPMESEVPKERVEEIQTMRAAHLARQQWLNRLNKATFTKPEVEWKPFLEAELYGDQSTMAAPWKRRLSDPAFEVEGHPRAVSPGAHTFSGTPTLLLSHVKPPIPTVDTGCGLQNPSGLVPSSPTTTTTTAPPTAFVAPPTTVATSPMLTATMGDKEALSLLASDQSVKAVSVESLHSLSDEEKHEVGIFKADLELEGDLQAVQHGDAAEDAVGADGKDDARLSVSAVRELWQKWSRLPDGASSPTRMADVSPPSVSRSASSTPLFPEPVHAKTAVRDTCRLTTHPMPIPMRKSKTMPNITDAAAVGQVHTNSESSELSNISKREEEKMVLEAGKAAHALARSVFI